MCQLKELEIELRKEYKEFLQTDKGKDWKEHWQKEIDSDVSGNFGDYLYDFYPEMLQ